ncbi:zinc transporter ZupT [Maridesulfovibrio bastinii]|jgi:ZIP family zinc transporter|uniref:zinc transporter ZupT n=1 Tax=Maridesulfovibrio bastinii TaxID=47157 RepID=UPI000424BAAB|nr:zinc transporter ZupT [Maridesulfovibrio bastinii]
MDHNLLFAFSLTLFAGLSTGIGSALAFFSSRTNTKFLALALGFSAGVMLYVSFIEIFVKAREALIAAWGTTGGNWGATTAFFAGIAISAIIDKLVPDVENPHEVQLVEDMEDSQAIAEARKKNDLMRMGVFTALAIAIHNFPEGLATFTAAMSDPELAIPIAIAIAIHNIPEGIAVSVPVFYATGSRSKAFWLSLSSGLAEPIGAGIGFLLLMPFMSQAVFGVLFGIVAGIMVFISLDELLPAAETYGEHHLCIYGLVAGMFVMALSLLLFL